MTFPVLSRQLKKLPTVIRKYDGRFFANLKCTKLFVRMLKLTVLLNPKGMNSILGRFMFFRRIINSVDLLKHILPKATFFPASVFSSNPKGTTNHPSATLGAE